MAAKGQWTIHQTVTHKCDRCGIHSSVQDVGCLSCNCDMRLCKPCFELYLSRPLRQQATFSQICIKCQRDKQIDICLT